MPRKPFIPPRRFPKRITKRNSVSEIQKANLKFSKGIKNTFLLLVIILLMTLIAIPLMDLANPERQYRSFSKSQALLGKVKDFGAGLNSMLLEACYNRNWYSSSPIQVDTSFTIESLQQLADELKVPCDVRQLTQSREIISKVSSGLTYPKSASDSLFLLYGNEARLIFETAAMLNWLVMDGYIVHEGKQVSMAAHVRTYKKFYPKVARKVNRNLDKLGLNLVLDTSYPGDPDIIAERCWTIDEALEKYIYPPDDNEENTLIRI